ETTEFRLSKRKFLLNLLKLIPKMKKIRKKAEEIIVSMKYSDLEMKIPTSEEIQQILEQICKPPHRRIGTEYAHEIEDYVFSKFKEFGLEDAKKEQFNMIYWSANNWKLIIQNGSEPIEIPCFYVLNTGFTDNNGITAPLVYVGTGEEKDFKKTDVKDKIVVADIEFPTLPLGKLIKLAKLFYVSDPKHSIDENFKLVLTFALTNFPPQALGGKRREDSVYWRAFDLGALGLILILRDYPSNVNSHWGPYDGVMKPIPALYVGKYDGIKVRDLVTKDKVQGTIILEGTKEPSFAHNIWGILPGKSEEMIMISSHHDSSFKGATEDGTGVAMVLTQLQIWAKIPQELRPRSLLFCLTAGHLYGGIGAENFAHKYKNTIMNNVLVDLNLEHMCAREVVEDPNTHNFTLTDDLALGAVFISRNEHLVAPVIKSCRDHNIEKLMLIPDNFFATPPIGEAGHFSTVADINVVHWIRSPYYLLTAEDTLDKVDMGQLNSTAQCISDLIVSLMNIPTNKLKSPTKKG
ncbi:MAG: M28 family peptidase, partial [Candidatus Thorarchaeota archaeon]